ncbi:hypothetical protein [Streptomyces sp. NBC_01429]|uniref:hypothetical protein n=1 Tax=Streptomyces sp. NBC_01429 TaxID=2903862 RepID=UPI002E2BD795|nr:hypothetical protein [Streptomyces sp. NBC_01429]
MTTATSTSSSSWTHRAPSRLWDRIGRSLMGFNAVLTFGVFINGLFLMADASDDRLMVEGWRTFGYFVFSALWALLAFRPRQAPVVWELIMFHKIAASALALTITHTTEGAQSAITDPWVALSTISAYVACRGWRSWRVLKREAALPTAA